MRVVESKMSNNECENTYSTDMGLVNFNLYSYQVLESRFKCNQGVSFQLPLHTSSFNTGDSGYMLHCMCTM